MRTTFHSRKRTATIGAALTAVLALALTACSGDDYASGSRQAGPQILKEGETAAFHITFPGQQQRRLRRAADRHGGDAPERD
ncbi:hypothetical protein OG473_36585 [Streptomyces anulatus]|uniref:hypothetical protein n=1 Tax=Streptomyces anulatus TaxID=1892 RepID=UPI00324CDD96